LLDWAAEEPTMPKLRWGHDQTSFYFSTDDLVVPATFGLFARLIWMVVFYVAVDRDTFDDCNDSVWAWIYVMGVLMVLVFLLLLRVAIVSCRGAVFEPDKRAGAVFATRLRTYLIPFEAAAMFWGMLIVFRRKRDIGRGCGASSTKDLTLYQYSKAWNDMEAVQVVVIWFCLSISVMLITTISLLRTGCGMKNGCHAAIFRFFMWVGVRAHPEAGEVIAQLLSRRWT
jgi:hypothetical protein